MKKLFYLFLALPAVLASCGGDDDGDDTMTTTATKSLTLNLTGLENLGPDFAYEGWIMVDGSPVSTGTFTVNDQGDLSQTSFDIASSNLDAATAFVLSIEPVPDNDPAPAATKILSGAFSGTTATVNTEDFLGDFSSTAANYILATPTTSDMTDELSGVWFLDPNGGSPVAGLTDLPALADGWVYEGWAVINGSPVSTGTFSSASGADNGAPFSGADNAGPPFPGEDFIMNAPSGQTFPTDLSGAAIVVSIEPVPDNSTAPFQLKPLFGTAPASAMPMTVYSINNQAATNFPGGSVSR